MSGVAWVLRQVLRALVGGAVFVSVLAGMPWALLALTRRVLADPPDLAMLVDRPMSAGTLVLFAVGGAWVFWGWLLVGAVLEVVDRVRRPARSRLRPPAPLYASVSAVVGTVALLLDGFAARGAVQAPAALGGGPAVTSTNTARASQVSVAARMPGSGVDVVGGWLPVPAAAAGAVSAWIWAQRRRQYQPQPPGGAHRDDPDLAPLPQPSSMDGRVVIGVADGRWLDLTDLPAGGVHLIGPGAMDALRGLLVTVLAAAGSSAVIVREDLRSLLGSAVDGVPGLHVVDDAAAVPAAGASLVAAGRRVVVVRGRAGRPDGWLDAVVRTGMTVVGVGTESALPTWHANADGTVAAVAVRLAVLNTAAAAVVLAGLRRAAPETGSDAVQDLPDPGAAPVTVRHLRVNVFGQVRVVSTSAGGDATAVHLRRTASRDLLVLLAVHRAGITGDDLAAALWPEPKHRGAAGRLKTGLFELRQALQHATGVDVLRRVPVLGGGNRHRLDPAHVEVDLWQFHDLLDATQSAAGQDTRRMLLRQAADLDRGELAEDVTGAWLAPVREATARHSIDILTYLADAEPDHAAALALLHRAARLAPENEAVHRAVLRRHAAAGDLDGVRRAYTALHERYAARSATPELATVQLYEDLTADRDLTASTGAPAPERTPR